MDETLKRRLVGAAVLLGAAFLLSLLLPSPDIEQQGEEEGFQRVVIDLNQPEIPSLEAAPSAPLPSELPPKTEETAAVEDPLAADIPGAPQIETPAGDEAGPQTEAASAIPPAPEVVAAPVVSVPEPAPAIKPQAPAKPSTQLGETEPGLKMAEQIAAAPQAAPLSTPVKPSPAPAAKPATTTPLWFVQVGSFSDIEKARAEQERLRPAITVISPVETQAGIFYRVRLGPYASKERATTERDRIAPAGRVVEN